MSKISDVLKQIVHFNFIISKDESEYRDFLKTQSSKFVINNKKILLVPLINDLGTMKIVIKLANKIAEEEKLQIKYFFVHCYIDSIRYETKFIAPLLNSLSNWSFISINRLLKIYNIRPGQLIMSNYFTPSKGKSSHKFSSKSDVLSFTHNDIEVGELLYDTFLRFRGKPTVDIHDDDLYLMKEYSISLINKWDDFFKNNKISKIVIPYMSYIHWGIPGKVAFKHNTEVVTFGSYLYILQKPSLKYPYHSKNFNQYRENFKPLADKEKCLEEAKQILENRLSGNIDKGISYMKSSAFGKKGQVSFTPPENNKWAVVFLHCFFDSPHIYGDGLFVDFYEWLTYILNKASQNPNITYYIKSHPNGFPQNELVVNKFIDKYSEFKNIEFLSKEVSNSDIIKGKPSSVFTYYGTVAHEFAYYGIPVIACGENPHSKYDFIYNAKSIDELDSFLEKVGEYGLPKSYNKNDILEFFYMHYIYYSSKYNQLNFELVKNIETGNINIPENSTISDLMYDN